jgi:peptide methionine sulfoxide reductase MsrB
MFAKKCSILLFIIGLSQSTAFRARQFSKRLASVSSNADQEQVADHSDWAPVVTQRAKKTPPDMKLIPDKGSKGLIRRGFIEKFTKISALPILSQAIPGKARAEGPSQGAELDFGAAPKGQETLMKGKDFGSCPKKPMAPLRWGTPQPLAERICCQNRHFAEPAGYWEKATSFMQEIGNLTASSSITWLDSITGKPLFIAPRGRTMEQFLAESRVHGWPSFRDQEVVQANVRVLGDGETISADGTHLGHNLPDKTGNRYCIDIACVAGMPRTA